MIVSREEAVGFLSKLVTDSAQVFGILLTGFGVLSFEFRIAEIASDNLMIEQISQGRFAGVVEGGIPSFINLNAVTEFSYGDIREAPQDSRPSIEEPFGTPVGVLTLSFSETEALVILEYE